MSKNALIISGVSWNAPWQRHHIVAQSLYEQGYDVDFLEAIISSSMSTSKILRKMTKKGPKSDSTNKADGINVINIFNLPPGNRFFNFLDSQTIRWFNQIRSNYSVVICYIPRNLTLNILKKISYERLVYDCVRDFYSWGGYSKEVLESERTLVEMATEVWCDSFWLKKKIKEYYKIDALQILPTFSLPVSLIDDEKFQIKSIKSAFYFGSLDSHVDVSVLRRLHSLGLKINFAGVTTIDIPDFIRNHGYISDQTALFDLISTQCDLVVIPYVGNMDGVIPSKLTLAIGTGKPILCSDFFDSRALAKNDSLEGTLFLYRHQDELKDILTNIENSSENYKARAGLCRRFLEENHESVFKKYM